MKHQIIRNSSFMCLFTYFSLSLVLMSCSKEENINPEDDTLGYESKLPDLNLEDMYFEYKESLSRSMYFKNEDLTNIEAFSDAFWCSVSIKPSEITVTVDEYNGPDERIAIIKLRDIKTMFTRTFKVIQKEYVSILHEFNFDDLTFEADEQSGILFHTTVYKTYNRSKIHAFADASWCKIDIINDPYLTITVKVDENNTYEERKATVTLTDMKEPDISRTFSVTRMQNNVIWFKQDYFTVGKKGRVFDIEFEHNVEDYEVNSSCTWTKVKINGTRGLITSSITVSVEENKSSGPRTAFITINSNMVSDPVRCRIDQE